MLSSLKIGDNPLPFICRAALMGCLDLFWVFIKIDFLSAGVAQLVERNLAKVEVASSRLVSRSRFPGRRAVALLFYWTEFFEPKKRCFLHEVLQGIWYNPPLAVLSI